MARQLGQGKSAGLQGYRWQGEPQRLPSAPREGMGHRHPQPTIPVRYHRDWARRNVLSMNSVGNHFPGEQGSKGIMALCPGSFPDCKLEIIWELSKIPLPRPHCGAARASGRRACISPVSLGCGQGHARAGIGGAVGRICSQETGRAWNLSSSVH